MKRYIIVAALLYVAILLSEATDLIHLGWTVVLSPIWFPFAVAAFVAVVILLVLAYNNSERNDDENWPNNLA